jgi:predicted nuclease of predicted toxin-antitoxin system
MKLNQVLSIVNQVEKSKFITSLDKLCFDAAKSNKKLAKRIDNIDGQIKNASGSEITQLYSAVRDFFRVSVKEQIMMNSAQINLLVNILSRDGNCVARISWIESLYAKEWSALQTLAGGLHAEMQINDGGSINDRSKVLTIYHACMKEAYANDKRVNRDSKVTDNERSMLNVLSAHLRLTTDDCAALEHLVDSIPKDGVLDALNILRDMGVVFISKKRHEVFVPDEIVELLNDIQGKDLADKLRLRLLRTFSDAELSNVLKFHGRKIRGIDRADKILTIIHSGISAQDLLANDMHSPDDNQNQRKERLKHLITDLDIDTDKLGTTLGERIQLIVSSLSNATDKEFESLSASGFKELLNKLQEHFPTIMEVMKSQFELEDNEIIDTEKLRALSITPYDILYLLSNDEVKTVRDSMGLSKRGNPRFAILECFADATDKLIDNYDALARRDINALREVGSEVAEAEIGVKFEEVTKAIFELLDLNIDEVVRKEINTAKDKADIIISLSDDDIIIGEAKTCKSGDFAKYSTTSRQVKAYVNRAEAIGKRVAQVLIIAPSFSDDFIESAEMDTEVNISLLEAKGLKLILDAFKAKRNPKFSAKLLTKGGLLKAELIAKTI